MALARHWGFKKAVCLGAWFRIEEANQCSLARLIQQVKKEKAPSLSCSGPIFELRFVGKGI